MLIHSYSIRKLLPLIAVALFIFVFLLFGAQMTNTLLHSKYDSDNAFARYISTVLLDNLEPTILHGDRVASNRVITHMALSDKVGKIIVVDGNGYIQLSNKFSWKRRHINSVIPTFDIDFLAQANKKWVDLKVEKSGKYLNTYIPITLRSDEQAYRSTNKGILFVQYDFARSNASLVSQVYRVGAFILLAGGILMALGMIVTYRLIISPLSRLVSYGRGISQGEHSGFASLEVRGQGEVHDLAAVLKQIQLANSDYQKRLELSHNDLLHEKKRHKAVEDGLQNVVCELGGELEVERDLHNTTCEVLNKNIKSLLGVMSGHISLLKSQNGKGQLDGGNPLSDIASRLNNTVDNLLLLSALQQGKVEIEPNHVSIQQVVETTVASFAEEALSENITLMTYIDPAPDYRTFSDRSKLRCILKNIFSCLLRMATNDDSNKQIWLKTRLSADRANFKLEIESNVTTNSADFCNHNEDRLALMLTSELAVLMGGTFEQSISTDNNTLFQFSFPRREVEDDRPAARNLRVPDLSAFHCILPDSRIVDCEAIKAYLEYAGAACVSSEFIASEVADSQQLIVLADIDRQSDDDRSDALRISFTPHFAGSLHQNSREHITIPAFCLTSEELFAALDFLLLFRNQAVCDEAVCDEAVRDEAGYAATASAVRNVQTGVKSVCKKRVLVVEDDATNRKVISLMLHSIGYESDVAEDGEEGYRSWLEGEYCAVLSDVRMPKLDGYSLARRIRENEAPGQHIPLLAITGDVISGEKEKALAAGFDAYLTKPIDMRVLEAALIDYAGEVKSSDEEHSESYAFDTSHLRIVAS